MGKLLTIFFSFSFLLFVGVLLWKFSPETIQSFFPTEKKEEVVTAEPKWEEQKVEELSDTKALLSRGQQFFDNGFLSLAISDFERATKLQPELKDAWQKLIGAQMMLRDYDGARKSVLRAQVSFSHSDIFLILLGQINLQQSDFTEAKKNFEKLSGSGRNFYRGLMASFFEDHKSALSLLEEAKKNPEYRDRARIILGAYEEFSLFPDGNPLHRDLLLAKAYHDLGFYEMAIRSSKNILKKEEKYRDAWILLGHSYLSLEQYQLAKNVLEEALAMSPARAQTAYFLGLTEAALKDYENAITHLTAAKKNGFTPRAEVMRSLAEVYVAAGYYEAAKDEYDALLRQEKSSPDLYIKPIFVALEYLKDTEYAEKVAREAVQKYPDNATTQNLLAWALLEKGDLTEAKEVLNSLLQQKPNFAPAHFNLGRVFEAEENWDEALSSYKTAYDIDPHAPIGSLASEHYNALVLKGRE